ncbi:MAG: ComEC/Rec2 family competence protein [Alphaproteobacteria bacterium]
MFLRNATLPNLAQVTSPLSRLADTLREQRTRWLLTGPIWMALGVMIWLSSPHDPPVWTSGLALCGAALLGWTGIRAERVWMLALALILGGYAAIGFEAWRNAGPVLPAELEGRWVKLEATVLQVDQTTERPRLLIGQVQWQSQRAADLPVPKRIRLTVSQKVTAPPVGARIHVSARLRAPSAPLLPGGYDFRRASWFQGIGAIGFVDREITVLLPPDRLGARSALSKARQSMAARIRAALAGDERGAAVASALLVGERRGIAEQDRDALRASGLAHLLAISGLHLGLVTLLVYGGIRRLLCLSERLALTRPIRKWAAAVALPAAFFYMIAVGAPVPTQRAFLMTAVVLVAVLLDRAAISLRLVAIAAMVVLAFAPSSLTGPSFQMSFAAVAVLVAAFESWRARLPAEPNRHIRRASEYIIGLAITSALAAVATGPIALFHFQQVPVFGVLANLVAVPLTALFVMPMGVLSYIAMPFGLEEYPLQAMAAGIHAVLWVAHAVEQWPMAVIHLPAPPVWATLLLVAGALWMMLWRGKVRFMGAGPALAGMAGMLIVSAPDLVVGERGRAVAAPKAHLLLAERSMSGFEREQWSRRLGMADISWQEIPNDRDVTEGQGWQCGPHYCLLTLPDTSIALLRRNGQARYVPCTEDLALLITVEPQPSPCRDMPVITAPKWGEGAIEVTRQGTYWHVTRSDTGDRSWQRQTRPIRSDRVSSLPSSTPQ